KICGLPPQPLSVLSGPDYFKLAAHGWLDSAIRTNALFYPGIWEGAIPVPATDAAVWMSWLGQNVTDKALQTRLSNVAGLSVQEDLPVQDYNDHQVGFIRTPLPALFYNLSITNAAKAELNARWYLSLFRPDGSAYYQAPPNGLDFGKTLKTPDANGNT